MKSIGFDFGSISTKAVVLDDEGQVVLTLDRRKGRDEICSIDEFLALAAREFPGARFRCAIAGLESVGGSGGISSVNSLMAIARGVQCLAPQARSVIEIGGHTSKFLRLGTKPGELSDFATNEACAAGTGSFLEQQAKRLGLTIEQLAGASVRATSGATVAGRCSVFAKSDMIHLQQKGTPVEEIAYGLCLAIARNALATLLKGREPVTPVVIAGGCARNAGVIRAFREILGGRPDTLLQSAHAGLEGAIGAALSCEEAGELLTPLAIAEVLRSLLAAGSSTAATATPITRVPADRRTEPFSESHDPAFVYLGVDLGSVSTDLVLLDDKGELVSSVYLPTRGRPVDVLLDGLATLEARFPAGLTIRGCGTTGSGRHLAARLLGADVVKNEITCQTLGARRYVPDADTILEIGGQDSKFISLRNGRISDFAMNKICAAGTGSFLEEQARELGVGIVGEFAERSFAASAPLDLGARCTVFMETEVVNAMRAGTAVDDICAGLAHSIVRNYLEKVVGTRPIGNVVVFQGGVASNDAVVAAFQSALGRPIHVHPYNRISGAIGAALAAIDSVGVHSDFRSLSTASRPSLRSFECGLCSNRCDVNVVEVDGKRAWFGDTCERYTSRGAPARTEDLPPNLAEEYVRTCESAFEGAEQGLTIGIPRASTMFGSLVFWATFFKCLGHRPLLSEESSEETLRTGLKHLAVGVCLPIKMTAGHVHSLIARGVDHVFIPSVVLLPGDDPEHSFSCPYAMAVPFIISAKTEAQFLSPVISLNDEDAFLEGFAPYREVLGASRGEMQVAFREAWDMQEQVDEAFRERAAGLLRNHSGHAFAVLGKPYNTLDPYMNLSLCERLRRNGVLAIPQKLLPFELKANGSPLPWRYSADIQKAAAMLSDRDDLHAVVVSNFGCGPDAFTFRQVAEELGARPHLFLEFDEHRGEAGLITRIEAFLDQLDNEGATKIESERPGTEEPSPVPLSGAVVRMPWFADHAYAFSGLLRFTGCDAAVLPPPDARVRALGERHSLGKECHAYAMLAGDLVELSRANPERHVTFFFPGTSLPCLLHEYGRGMRVLLRDLGIENVTVSTPSGPDLFAAYSIEALERFYLGLMSVELLVKAVCQIRPYERESGMADAIHRENLARVEEAVAGGNILAALDESLGLLSRVPIASGPRRPIIGIAGDVYTKTNAVANEDLFRWLEDRGVEVWPAPFLIDLLDFGISRRLSRSVERLDLPSLLLSGSLAVRRAVHQWRVNNIVDGRIARHDEPDYTEMKKLTARYMPNEAHELLFINVTKIVDFAQRGADGIINAICFNCMVGNASAAILERIRADFHDVPIMSAVYSGGDDPSRRMGLDAFVDQTFAFHRRKEESRVSEAVGLSWPRWPRLF